MGVSGLLRAKHVGIRDLKNRLSEYLEAGEPLIATHHGSPKYFMVPYAEMVELVEMLEEAAEPALVSRVAEARASYGRGEWVPASRLWKRLGFDRKSRRRS